MSVACQMSKSDQKKKKKNLTRAVTPPCLEGAELVSSAEEGLVGGKGVASYSPPTWSVRHQYIGIVVRGSRALRVLPVWESG